MTYKLSLVLLAIVAGFSVVMLFLIFFPVTVIEPNTQPYKVLTDHVEAGRKLVYVVDACKWMDVQGEVKREVVVENVHYELSPSEGYVPNGCKKTNVSVTIPDVIPAGKAYLVLTVTYPINVMRNEIYHFTTEKFDLLEATPSAN